MYSKMKRTAVLLMVFCLTALVLCISSSAESGGGKPAGWRIITDSRYSDSFKLSSEINTDVSSLVVEKTGEGVALLYSRPFEIKSAQKYILSYDIEIDKKDNGNFSVAPVVRDRTLGENMKFDTSLSVDDTKYSGGAVKRAVMFSSDKDTQSADICFEIAGTAVADIKISNIKITEYGKNTLFNAGFEYSDYWEGAVGFEAFPSGEVTGNISIEANGGVSGNALKIEAAAANADSFYTVSNRDGYAINVNPSEKYRITYKVKGLTENVFLRPSLRQLTDERTDTCENTYYYLGTDYDITGITDGWQTVSFEFITAPDAGQLHFWLLAYNGTMLVDDVTVEQIYHINKPIGTTSAGWEFVNNASVAEGVGPEGGNAVLLHTEGEMSNVPEAVNYAEYKYSFVNGREYTLSYRIKGLPISKENFLVYTGLQSQTETDHSQLFNNAAPEKDYYDEWEKIECDFTANGDSPMAGKLQFVFRSWAGTNADVLITDISVIDKLTGENMIKNSSFYSNASGTGWEVTNTYTGNISYYTDSEDNGVAVLTGNGNGIYGAEDDFHITTPIKLMRGETYTFSYKVRGGTPASALYVYLPSVGAEWGTQLVSAWQQNESITEWKEVSVEFTANSESNYLRFMLNKWAEFSYEIKDVSIKDANGKEYLLNGNFNATDESSIIIPEPQELSIYNADFSESFSGIIGDSNENGKVDIKDLIRLKKLLSQSAAGNPASDIDNSGQLEATDLAALRQILIGVSAYI